MKCGYIFAAHSTNSRRRRTLYAGRITKISFLALLLAIPLGLMAQEQPLNKSSLRFSLGASAGLLHGQGEEIVFWKAGSDRKLSQLLYDSKPIGYAGVDLSLDWQKAGSRWGFFTDGTFKFGFPGKSGRAQDSDWTEWDYPDWLIYYSVHDNTTERAILIDANIGASFRLFDFFLLKAYLAYNFIEFAWTASGGSFLYPANDGGHRYRLDSSFEVGKYRQTWHIISPALAFYGKFNRYFDIELAFAISPFIWCDALDNHLIRNPPLDFFFDMKGGLFIEPKLVFSYTPKKFLSLSLAVSYRNISGTRGNEKYVQQGKDTIEATDRAGAGYHGFDVGLIAKFNFYGFDIWKIGNYAAGYDLPAGYRGPVILNQRGITYTAHNIYPHAPAVQSQNDWQKVYGDLAIKLQKPANPDIDMYLMVR
jgi:outer membrane protease